jgi:hypothetical protein
MNVPTADLTKPKASTGWVIGAFFAGLLLMGVMTVVSWTFGKAKTVGKSATGKITGSGSGENTQFYLS